MELTGQVCPCLKVKQSDVYRVPKDHIFLVSWGYPESDAGEALENYISDGGRCVIIIGEDERGCTYPSYDYFAKQSQWTTELIEIPNFHLISTKMSVSIRK